MKQAYVTRNRIYAEVEAIEEIVKGKKITSVELKAKMNELREVDGSTLIVGYIDDGRAEELKQEYGEHQWNLARAVEQQIKGMIAREQ